ncbi:MAG: hypothetical protein J2O48_08160 [Solirubrobacterales bacterium]|nr:hypothetical protein [Solirubrobacterales bacterium]
MNVPARNLATEKLLKTPFRGRNRASVLPQVRAARRTAPQQAPSSPPNGDPASPELEDQLDSAVYTCSCGFVFQAQVLTSVDCPHCGNSQAW